jgi:hypothetical protein
MVTAGVVEAVSMVGKGGFCGDTGLWVGLQRGRKIQLGIWFLYTSFIIEGQASGGVTTSSRLVPRLTRVSEAIVGVS